MAKGKKELRGWEAQLKGARDVLAALHAKAPRDSHGELQAPYRKWAEELASDIARLEKWTESNRVELTEKGKEAVDEN